MYYAVLNVKADTPMRPLGRSFNTSALLDSRWFLRDPGGGE